MPEPFFSIIIPAYNEEKYLPLCLDSINNLDYPKDKYEVIVVDNGSTDRTREIAGAYAVKVLRDDTRNVSGLRNLGADHAVGDILAFVDADCIVSKSWLKFASRYYQSADIIAWGAPAKPPVESTWVQRTWYLVRQRGDTVQTVDWLETMNLFVRKEQFFAIGGFNEKLITCEDVDLSYRISKFGRIVSDGKLEVCHFGEAKTVREFIRKEIWRGASNLSGLSFHGFSLKELPSLSVPVYFGLFLPIVLVGIIIFLNRLWILIWAMLYLLPSVAVFLKLGRKKNDFLTICRLFYLVQIYFVSRTFAVLYSGKRL